MTELELDAFLAVVRTGSITAAARSLYVTQPALSRRIRALEEELGYPLMLRGKGVRTVELTERGRAFVEVAERWKGVWREARELREADRSRHLHLACINSVSAYILPLVARRFLEENPGDRLTCRTYPSLECYGYVARGQVDLALISDDMYSAQVETVPLFRERMLFIAGKGEEGEGPVHPSQLDPADQVRLPWNPECDLWHDFWFGSAARPKVLLDQTSVLEEFLRQDRVWALAPASAALELRRRTDAVIRPIQEGPPDRIIYYLTGRGKKPAAAQAFLDTLRAELAQVEGIELC